MRKSTKLVGRETLPRERLGRLIAARAHVLSATTTLEVFDACKRDVIEQRAALAEGWTLAEIVEAQS